MKSTYLNAIIIALFVFCYVIPASATEKTRVTFINPGVSDINDPTGGFWLSVSSFMKAAAEDLNIELEVLYSERNHILMQKQAEEVIKRKNPPDYLVVVNEKMAADDMVKAADKAGVKVFVMLNRFVGEQEKEMGFPREKYKYFIGTLIPDNHFAGYQIAKLLFDRALEGGAKADDGQLHVVAIAGDYVTQASVERVNGLKKAVSEYSNIWLDQVFVGMWRKDKARSVTEAALSRYPKTRAIWAANDPMALGAMEAAIAAGKKPGKDIFFGGLNWDVPGLEKVKEGSMVTTIGGHFMTGGWALVLLHDYHHGKDFAEEGLQLKRQIFGALHSQNIDLFLEKFGDRNWSKIDFTKFSKFLNPQLTQYDFSIETLLRQ